MTEEIRPSPAWYHRKIRQMEDHDYLIGPSAFPAEHEGSPTTATIMAFGALLRLERRNKKLTVSQLADLLNVEEEEIRGIEHDLAYRARPRTILAIASHFDLPEREVMKLAGAVASNDEGFANKAMRFAAHSDDIGALSKEEQQLLHSFVEFLRDRK